MRLSRLAVFFGVSCVAAAGVATACGSSRSGFAPGAVDAGFDATSMTEASADVIDTGTAATDSPTLVGDANPDASCDLGSAGSFATQTSLNLFGQTVFYADGGALPPGHYRITYVDGCMKYSSAQDWTVNAYAIDASLPGRWFLVNGPGDEAGTTDLLEPPGTVGYLVANGGYATFGACVTANLQLDQPIDFDYDGGPLGLWLQDNPYSDNVTGDEDRNPTWRLTLFGPCPSAQ